MEEMQTLAKTERDVNSELLQLDRSFSRVDGDSTPSLVDDTSRGSRTNTDDHVEANMHRSRSNDDPSDGPHRWSFDTDTQTYTVRCPKCLSQCHLVPLKQLNCKQFACGAHVRTGKPLNPHIKPGDVAKLLQQGQVMGGCGGRFKFNPKTDELSILV